MSRIREKTFDAVQMMREIRDRLSEQIKGMDFDQEQRFIEERLRDGRAGNSDTKRRQSGH